jgi:phosphoglycolate phosphatase-like HAD superfamily hydrolase
MKLAGATFAFDLDGTLVDTAPDLIGALNVVLTEQDLPTVPLATERLLVGRGARGLVERGFHLEAALDQLAGAGADHVARRMQGHRRHAFTVEHEIERGNQVGRGVDEGAVEVEDNSAGKGHGNSLAAGKPSCK